MYSRQYKHTCNYFKLHVLKMSSKNIEEQFERIINLQIMNVRIKRRMSLTHCAWLLFLNKALWEKVNS